MGQSWMNGLFAVGLHVGVVLGLSGCNAVAGAVDGFGRQIDALVGWVRPDPPALEIGDAGGHDGTSTDLEAGAVIASQRAKRLLWPKSGKPAPLPSPASRRNLERTETSPKKSASSGGQGEPKIALAAVELTTPPSDDAIPDFRVQVAAVRDQTDADKAWDRLQVDHAAVMKGMQPHITRAETPKGIIYRVQTGSFRTRRAADRFCVRLEERGAICFVVAV